MAYAAATCLKKTIERLLNYPKYISLVPPSREAIKAAHAEAESLMALLHELDETSKSRSRKKVNALDGEIREAVSEFEDVLESRVADQLLSQSDRDAGTRFSIDLLDIEQDLRSFTERVTELKRTYDGLLQNMFDEEEDDDDDVVVSSVTDFGGIKPNVVGLSDQFHKMKDRVVNGSLDRRVDALIGMGGIGKTTLAKEIFDDADVKSRFYPHVWVTLSRKCRSEEILRAILAQVSPDDDQGDDDMAKYLKESLKGRRFLLVIDDVWEEKDWFDVVFLTPDDKNGSRVLLTSRLHREVDSSSFSLEVRFLNKEESWELLREKVFGKEQCPPSLVKVGKKIAEKCDGLPLTIVTVAKLLTSAEMTPEYWDDVTEDRNSVFTDAYGEISKVLYPSYDYLLQHLKMCFLSAGGFPRKTVIPRSKLVNMWGVEEFLVTPKEVYVEELVYNSLLLVYETSSTKYLGIYSRIKTCGVHSSLWHLCNREATKNKSFHVLRRCTDGLSEDVKSQRRLCIHNSTLFAIKDVHSSIEDDCASTARSLGCYGPYHPYQVPVTFGLRLLRLLDALTIRFYEFPIQVVNLVLLRYLALTYNGTLPASISKLWNLQFLIVRHHLRTIKGHGAPMYLPMEIWDLKELKHLQVMGSDLPDPSSDTFLPNLSTLLDVSECTCTKGVLKRTPNLKKLGLRIELRPDADEPLSCFAHLYHLNKLEILKCVVVNPILRPEITPLLHFPLGIRKLTLSGLCYSWEEMSKVASLPKLQVLKLRNYAFRGPKWHMRENGFKELTLLIIEDTDLVKWTVEDRSFGISLSCISLMHCYKLQKIKWRTHGLPLKIQVVDCNPLVLPRWKKIVERHSSGTPIEAHSSWDDGRLTQEETSSDWKVYSFDLNRNQYISYSPFG